MGAPPGRSGLPDDFSGLDVRLTPGPQVHLQQPGSPGWGHVIGRHASHPEAGFSWAGGWWSVEPVLTDSRAAMIQVGSRRDMPVRRVAA